MTDTPTPRTLEEIRHLARAFQESRTLLAAVELGVFAALADGPLPSGAVAGRIGADPRATDRLLRALAVLGLVEHAAGLFANTETAGEALVPGRPGFLADLAHLGRAYAKWGELTEAVRAGSAVSPPRDDAATGDFIAAMHHRALAAAAPLAAGLDLSGVRRILDVGGGSGAYAMAFARVRDDIEVTVLDTPAVARLTRRYVAEAGLAGRIAVVDGDFHRDSLGQDFDLIFLSAIATTNGARENAALLARAVAAASPGGRIVVRDFIMDDERLRPRFGTLVALTMLVHSRRGDTYTETEIAGWLRAAGCAGVTRLDIEPAMALLIGHCP